MSVIDRAHLYKIVSVIQTVHWRKLTPGRYSLVLFRAGTAVVPEGADRFHRWEVWVGP